jgi:hypothetical protein
MLRETVSSRNDNAWWTRPITQSILLIRYSLPHLSRNMDFTNILPNAKIVREVQNQHRPDDRSSTHLWNVGLLQRDYTVRYPRKLSPSSISLLAVWNRQYQNLLLDSESVPTTSNLPKIWLNVILGLQREFTTKTLYVFLVSPCNAYLNVATILTTFCVSYAKVLRCVNN